MKPALPAHSSMPDLKPQVYKDPRPAEYFTGFHERARTREPDWVYELARIVLTPPTLLMSTIVIAAESAMGSVRTNLLLLTIM